MGVLGGWAFSYERGIPAHDAGGCVSISEGPAQTLPRWGCIHGGRVGIDKRRYFSDLLLVEKGTTEKGFQDLHLKAKAVIWS